MSSINYCCSDSKEYLLVMSLSTYNGRLNKIVLIYYEFYLLCYKDTKKNRTSASFLLTKCATFFVRRYEGTFSVPSEALVVLYAYGSLIISVSIASGNGVVSGFY